MSSNSYEAYCSDVREMFSSICKVREVQDLSPQSITKEELTGYVESRANSDEPVSKRTQARILSSLRSFFGWLVMEGEIE